MCTLNENSKYAENVGRYAINSKTYEENSVNWSGNINCYFEYKIDNWQSNWILVFEIYQLCIPILDFEWFILEEVDPENCSLKN